ncbi:hypothetical protein [uncultured Shimia sp.]|uniref:hypothetical protein n=1 Tax=uncultured Shimia sp. TaxID=573152 RepID=UPI00262EFAD6|nr:hypothetical protein [uncultured Shimia sp.]
MSQSPASAVSLERTFLPKRYQPAVSVLVSALPLGIHSSVNGKEDKLALFAITAAVANINEAVRLHKNGTRRKHHEEFNEFLASAACWIADITELEADFLYQCLLRGVCATVPPEDD